MRTTSSRGLVLCLLALYGVSCLATDAVTPLDDAADDGVVSLGAAPVAAKKGAAAVDVKKFVNAQVAKTKANAKPSAGKEAPKAAAPKAAAPKAAAPKAAKPCHHDGCFKGAKAAAPAAKAPAAKKAPCHHDGCFGGVGKKGVNNKADMKAINKKFPAVPTKKAQQVLDAEKPQKPPKKAHSHGRPRHRQETNNHQHRKHHRRSHHRGHMHHGHHRQQQRHGSRHHRREERHRRREEQDEHQSLRESIDTHGGKMSSFEKRAFARYQAQALQESDYMVKRIMMKHDKAQRKMKREAIKSDEEAMNTMHEDEDEDSMNQLGEDRKKKEENDMNEMKSDNDTDMNRELGEGVDNDEDHHHKEKRRQSRKLGDSQESGAAAQVEAEAKEIAGGKEPFNSEPVTGEDGDQHFVMTDKLRRKELQEAAYGKSESTPERQEASIAEETERERRAISMYQAMDEKKRIADQKRERMHRYVEKKLSEHSLMRDSKGRVVPNV